MDAWASDGPLSGGGYARGEAGTHSPTLNMCLSARLVTALHGNILLSPAYPFGGRIQSLMGSPHQTMATVR